MSNKYQPISPQQLAYLASLGRGGDTMLAHINPEEAEMLKRMGGSGTINPKTGLREYVFAENLGFGSVWDDGGDWGGGSDYDFGGGGYNDSFGYGDSGFTSPSDGGFPGGIPGYDNLNVGDTLPAIDTTGLDTGPVVPGAGLDIVGDTVTDTIPTVVDTTPVLDTTPIVDTPVDTVAADYWAEKAAEQQAEWERQAAEQQAEWQRQADAQQAEWQRLADIQAANDLANATATNTTVDTGTVGGGVTDTQIANDAAASVIPGDSTIIQDYVGNTVGSITNGTNNNNITVIPGSGSTTTGLLDGYVPTETGTVDLSNIAGTGTSNVVDTGAVIPTVIDTGTGTLDLGNVGAVTPNTDIITSGTDSTLVQVGDNTFLDTTTGAIVTGTGDTIVGPITPGPGTLVASANTGTVTDTGPVVPGLTTTTDTGDTGAVKLDVTGAAGTADAPQYVTDNSLLTPGTMLATNDQVDSGLATFNSAANAWEISIPLTGSLDFGPGVSNVGTDINTILGNVTGPVTPVDLGPYTPLDVTPGNIGSWYTNTASTTTTDAANNIGTYNTPNARWMVDSITGIQYPVDSNYERIGPDFTYSGTTGQGNLVVANANFAGTTSNLTGGGSNAGNITYSNVTLGDANVSGVTGGSNANITLDNVTGGNVTGNVSGPVVPSGNITITDSTMGNVANINTDTSNLSVGNATTSNITNINSNLTTSNIANTIANSISNSTSNISDTTIANTFANTIANVLSTTSNANISNTVVGNISNSLSNVANANISNTQANNISNVITILTNSNIANANAGSIFNVVSNIANSNISNTTVRDVSNVISNVANSNISNTIANSITNSVSNLSNVVISNSTANIISNVASNIANIIVSNSSSNIANIITTNGNANGNANIATLVITANTLPNANVIANVLGNSNVVSNINSNVIANVITNANVIANVLTNANVIANVLTNANVIANVLTNANVIANVLTNANVISNVLTNVNVVSNVANVTSNVANVANITGNVTLGTGLNPGYMAPTAFYNTYNPAQSKFYWGQHGFQEGPKFNEVLYNQAAAPNTPWGLQQVATPLTSQQINDIVMGRNVTTPVVPNATRREAFAQGPVAPSYGQRKLEPKITNQPVSNVAYSPSTTYNNPELTRQLGANWFNRQQAAANAGDWDTYFAIQKQVDQILNPVIDRP